MEITTTTKKEQVFNWLLERGITKEIIHQSDLTWNGREIVIPVFDKDNNFIFNKYRRDPFELNKEIPKYRYELGSTSSLFNIQTIINKTDDIIFIVEGELDALLLNSFGLNAVSSTGGASTFKEEWISNFNNNQIYIVYDLDDAGIKGALRINSILPSAKIVFLPSDTKGKDITDYFKDHTMKQFEKLVSESSSWTIPVDVKEIPKTKTAINKIIKEYTNLSNDLLERQREEISKGNSIRHIEIMQDTINKRIEGWKKLEINFGRKFTNNSSNDIERAKSVPITNFVKFDGNGFARCLWHNEKSGSMKYYKNVNKTYCFGCQIHKDVIDVIMNLHSINFNEAIKFLLNRN